MGNKYSKANIKNQVREAIIANTLTEKKTEKIVSVLAKLFIDTEMGYQWDDGELAATIEKALSNRKWKCVVGPCPVVLKKHYIKFHFDNALNVLIYYEDSGCLTC
uniref:Dynein light chain n=1 Tax=Acrobeloides nanus TaxID=290746 RepID=A0A914D8I2_9BILA